MKSHAVISVLVLLWGFSTAYGSGEKESAKEAERHIRSVLERQVEGWNNGSIEQFMQGYVQSDSLRFASGGTVTYGWQKMLGRYRKKYDSKELMGRLSFSDVTVEILSDDSAMAFGRWTVQRNGDAPWGLFTLLLKKINGDWRIVHDHTSSGN